MTKTPRRKIDQSWLNQQFAQDGWEKRLASYTKVEIYNSLTPREHGQVEGTLTIGHDYYDAENALVATIFHYRKPDGNFGASGKPCPKGLLIDGIWCHT
ncbi:MAG TPA: hypothetical protein VIW68_03845 [Candidatus Sulfotelmatobacter sp.]